MRRCRRPQISSREELLSKCNAGERKEEEDLSVVRAQAEKPQSDLVKQHFIYIKIAGHYNEGDLYVSGTCRGRLKNDI